MGEKSQIIFERNFSSLIGTSTSSRKRLTGHAVQRAPQSKTNQLVIREWLSAYQKQNEPKLTSLN